MWRAAFKSLALALASTLTLGTSVARADTSVNITTGLDAWHTPDPAARYLPDYGVPATWQAAAPWLRAKVQHRVPTDWGALTLTGAGKTDPVTKGRIDRLDADWRLGQSGVRLGILPYRISWCRDLGQGPWIAEPDAFCRFSGLNEVSQGAFGVQAYRATLAAGFLIDTMAGIYRPRVDGQNDKLGPFLAVGPTVRHHAHGASVNAIHLATGIEARAGWLRTAQDQDSDTGSFQRQIRYDSYYLAAQGNINPRLDLRLSLSGYLGEQINPANPFNWDGRSWALELIYKPASAHSLAAGLSRYNNVATYATPPNGQRLQVDSLSLAWRTDWADGISTTAQATRSTDDSTTRNGVITQRQGSAYGVRVSKVF